MASSLSFTRRSFLRQVSELPWGLILLLCAMAVIGLVVLYSSTFTNPAEAGLPLRQAIRLVIALIVLIIAALFPLRLWLYLAWPAYFATLFMLVLVEFFGASGGGAERWLSIPGLVRVQPSEFMKVTLTLALAAYYHKRWHDFSGGFSIHLPALLLIMAPALLIFRQPDFGTTLALIASGGVLIFLAGLYKRVILTVGVLAIASIPTVYIFVLKDYQRERVDTYLAQLTGETVNVMDDGYQIEQARIAIGSGGMFGKGYMQGIQAQLDYIPEQHTDFILTVLAEEFGFVTTTAVLLMWMLILGLGMLIGMRSTSLFGRFAAFGAMATISFYIFFNVAMVLGLLPVVGVPLPLLSYGGTVMLTTAICFGLVCAVHLAKDEALNNA
ncbi:MAG: rod shape-determining protein RodA [Hyphomonadaceae bacterium]|nr:rod shape-determining protein RodA [Hyphomonadaceae bacterium]OUX93771.1 MAG: rod shape-determining protein RodA [Hyphomonas sp. TMED17]CAI8317322.1 MAG: Peptidoglycan glycosyltransferase MrdB [Hyphomonas sp. TMED17]